MTVDELLARLIHQSHQDRPTSGLAIALAEAGFARRSKTAGGDGNPPRVPINNDQPTSVQEPNTDRLVGPVGTEIVVNNAG
jgi:hypothetical protein